MIKLVAFSECKESFEVIYEARDDKSIPPVLLDFYFQRQKLKKVNWKEIENNEITLWLLLTKRRSCLVNLMAGSCKNSQTVQNIGWSGNLFIQMIFINRYLALKNIKDCVFIRTEPVAVISWHDKKQILGQVGFYTICRQPARTIRSETFHYIPIICQFHWNYLFSRNHGTVILLTW